MNRRKFVKASTGGIAAAGVPVAVSAKTQESFSSDDPRGYEGFVTEVGSETYLTVLDKQTGAVKVDEVEESKEIDGKSIKNIKDGRHETQVTKDSVTVGDIKLPDQSGSANQVELTQMSGQAKQVELARDSEVEAAVETLAGTPEIIERSEGYSRKKDGDKYCKNDCNHHWVDGVSMEFNSLVARASKAVIITAVLTVIAGSGSGALVAIIGNGYVRAIISAVAGGLVGASLSIGSYDYDINYVVGSKKMMAVGYGLGPWKPGKSGLIEMWTRGGHGARCDWY